MLHNHSNYTMLSGAIAVDALTAAAKSYGMSSVALTDTDSMYGLVKFFRSASAEGIKPVLGSMITEPGEPEVYAVFLARNIEGYSLLCRIITERKLKEGFHLVDVFSRNLDDLFVITPSLKLLMKLKERGELKRNIYAELISTPRLRSRTRRLYEFCLANSVAFVASNPAYFLKAEDHLLHRVLTAIRMNKALANLKSTDAEDEEFCFKSPDDMKRLWRALPGAISNAEYILENCNVDLQPGRYKFPVFPLPEGETSFSYLWKICFRGLEERYQPITQKAIDRLQHELNVIDRLNFCDYFLIVWDIVREARRRGMMSIGRGSAANSLAAYCLGLSQVDPLEHNLYFERFLNLGRTSPPDVDLDFSWKERDEIVRYVYEKYGYSRVAMISTHVTFRARSAFRETAKVFGIPEEEISRISKFIPWTTAQNLKVLSEKFPESRSLKFDDEPWRTIIDIASRLADYPRHLSIHPGGIVVTSNPVTDYLALEYAKNKGLGLIITQPDMYSVEDMGLIKIDLLSQRSLGVLRDTLISINRRAAAEHALEHHCEHEETSDSLTDSVPSVRIFRFPTTPPSGV